MKLFLMSTYILSISIFAVPPENENICPVLSKLTPKAPHCTSSLFRSALNHPAFVVGFLLLVWFCLTEIHELPNPFSCCINEGWMLPGYRAQETGMFPVNLEVWLWHTQSLMKSSQFFGRLFNSNLGYVAMSLMSRSDYPGWLEL